MLKQLSCFPFITTVTNPGVHGSSWLFGPDQVTLFWDYQLCTAMGKAILEVAKRFSFDCLKFFLSILILMTGVLFHESGFLAWLNNLLVF